MTTLKQTETLVRLKPEVTCRDLTMSSRNRRMKISKAETAVVTDKTMKARNRIRGQRLNQTFIFKGYLLSFIKHSRTKFLKL